MEDLSACDSSLSGFPLKVDMIGVYVDILVQIPLDASPDLPAYNVSAIADIIGDPDVKPEEWENSVARVMIEGHQLSSNGFPPPGGPLDMTTW